MKTSLLALLAAASMSMVLGAPNPAVCNPANVQLELRPLGTASARSQTGLMGDYQLAFVAVDNQAQQNKADFIDIHYRVNNEDSVNLRVLTDAAMTENNQRAKQAQVDGIQLEGGDVIRAYATYSVNGVACDTAIHTFNAPELEHAGAADMRINAMSPPMRSSVRRDVRPRMLEAEDASFWSQAAEEAEQNTMAGVCPGIALDQEILKQAGLQNTYVITFENKDVGKQLHYVDLHMSKDAGNQWDNLRLASDMQLDNAHKVMQPGVVVMPNEQLSWYWSYRTSAADGSIVDCSTAVTTIDPAHQVTHEVDLAQLASFSRQH